jgi:anion-transporting  ArsA/GET3 family ATPase
MRWFLQAFQSTGKVSFNLLARSAALVLRGLGRITGAGFLAAMAELITELNDLFGGFRERAKVVESALRSPDVSFVLVTSPAPMSLEEVVFFSQRLAEAKMPRGAFVVNRYRQAPPAPAGSVVPTERDAAGAITARGLGLGDDAGRRVLQAYGDAVRLAALDEHHVHDLRDRSSGDVPIVRVPELASDVHDLKNLGAISDVLMRGGI